MSSPSVTSRAALLLLLLLFTPLLSHALGQPSPAALLEEVAGSARLAGGHGAAHARDARLPLPTPQEIDALRKVAQILAMLGEQVIPALVGPTAPSAGNLPAPGVGAGAGEVDGEVDAVDDD